MLQSLPTSSALGERETDRERVKLAVKGMVLSLLYSSPSSFPTPENSFTTGSAVAVGDSILSSFQSSFDLILAYYKPSCLSDVIQLLISWDEKGNVLAGHTQPVQNI
jgi:hypothetical protein